MTASPVRKTCTVAGCEGSAVNAPRCLAHMAPERLERVLNGFTKGLGLDASGVELDRALLDAIVAHAPRLDAKPDITGAVFSDASFPDATVLSGMHFGNDTSFEGATFGRLANFEETQFGDRVTFRRARFGPNANFSKTRFGERASFVDVTFGNEARFDRAEFGPRASFASESRFGDKASFRAASFGRGVHFDGAVFGHGATFRDASFAELPSLRKTTFPAEACFDNAVFGDEASFSRSSLGTHATFIDAKFGRATSFREVEFGERATLTRVQFSGNVRFARAKFGTGASFSGGTFAGDTDFSEAVLGGRSDFEDATFAGRISFRSVLLGDRTSFRLATFLHARRLGPLVAHGLLVLDEASFLEPVNLQVSAERLTIVRTSFGAGADIRVRWADIACDLAEFGAPSVLAASEPFLELDEAALKARLQEHGPRPALVSLRHTDTANLVVSDTDLSGCRFAGCHGLERLRIDGEARFAAPPRWRATRRRVIAEEQEWRARRTGRFRSRWDPPRAVFPIERVERMRTLEPGEIAVIYRALRKGREDEGNAPGAADFYYGEMEMRRFDERTTKAERLTIWLYWLVSGYGLRGLRALAALLATIVVFGFLLWRTGFTPQPGFTRALLFSAESTSSLFRVPDTPGIALTETGEALQIVLRLLGPLFFGLALLSLRGRVKR